MVCNCLGYRRLDFVNDESQLVRGYKVFISYPEQDVTGFSCDNIFFSDEALRSLDVAFSVGKSYDIQFTRKGRVSSVSSVD